MLIVLLAIGLGRLLALLLIFMFVVLRFWDPLPVQILRLKTFDFYQIAKPRTVTAHPRRNHVDIDEAES